MTKHTILCVDDEIDNVEALERLFRKKYTVLKATSGKHALQILDHYPAPIAAIITDQRMPEMTGVEFLENTLEKFPDTSRLLLTGYTDLDSVISAVNKGQIFRYLTKPWNSIDLTHTLDQAVEKFLLTQQLKEKNKELVQALAELKTLDAAKNQFMVLINHELKTPLTSILNYAAILAEGPQNEEQKLYTHRIQLSAERLKSLIEDTLLLVRSEMNLLSISPSGYTFSNFSNELKSEIKDLMKNKSLQLEEKLEPVSIQVDRRLFTQVIERLIHNAAKFSSENSVIVLESKLENDKLRFTIRNEGSKISDSVKDKIFKPFFIDEDIMNHTTGVGLGLTVCQVILKKHQSELHIANTSTGVEVTFDILKT